VSGGDKKVRLSVVALRCEFGAGVRGVLLNFPIRGN
jgi:hypothetical protein